ncbi:hypothetical protein [Marinospirillum sp.]|uniref:hypothetical protein n=1 Tax=Marinospirillum sp. TaxID=2183934 RepID=UPI00287035F8|nr:hypothetical protein [Marinospirillum sp.]MDR9468854.1 hypothetical protein [Marinospirillum sp.]
MSTGYKKHQQGGFILALALIMMLFVGVVVITSSERTGQETRQAQSNAPTATLQAAAEAGLLTLRQKINEATSAGSCSDQADIGPKEFCECLVDNNDKITNTRLAEIMGNKGFPENEKLFSSKEGLPDISWWFESGTSFLACYEGTTNDACKVDDLEPETDKICRIVADVFVGDPTLEPGSFMTGTIKIETKPHFSGPDELNKLADGIDWDSFDSADIASLIDGFYSDNFDFSGDEYVKMHAVTSSGTVLSEDDLDDNKLNLIVLSDDSDGVQLGSSGSNLGDKEVMIISRSEGTIKFSTSGNNKSPEGWIIAPNADVVLDAGANNVEASIVSSSCTAGNNKNKPECNGDMAGGAKLSNFTLKDFETGLNDNESTGNVTVDSSEEMDMDFDY